MREKARQDKSRAKRERRQNRDGDSSEADDDAVAAPAAEDDDAVAAPEAQVLAELAGLHERFEADRIDFDEFEARKHELLAQLDV
jgi:hypothetical protein